MRKGMLRKGLETVMLETDCPTSPPALSRGQVCEPLCWSKNLQGCAEIFGVDKEYVATLDKFVGIFFSL